MKRLFVLIAGLGLLAGACAPRGAVTVGPVGGSPSPSQSPAPGTPEPTPTTSAGGSPGSGQTVSFQVWFTRGEHLFVTRRTVPATVAVGRAALTAMLDGPSAAEAAAGVGTAVPAGTSLNDLAIAGGVATVDLSGDYESGGGSLSMSMRLAQVVYTITQYPTVDGVDFRLDGRPVKVFSGEGIILDHPVTRADYEDLLPLILVQSPEIGQRVSSPVTVSGTANVFEATVSIRILDENGRAITDTFTTASCGTGCRGTYSKAVAYEVDHEQRGTVMVFESSAQDGSPTNVVEIPVTLTT